MSKPLKSPVPPFHPKFFPYPNRGWPDREGPPDGVCQLCGVQNAPLFVCLIELAFMVSVLALYIQHYMAQELQTTMLTVSFTFALLSAVVAVCLILSLAVGLCLETSLLLVPHMIGQIVGICIMTIIGAVTLLFTFTGVQYPSSLGEDFGTVFLAIAVLCLAMALAEVWFFFLIRDAYVHLKRKEEEEDAALEARSPMEDPIPRVKDPDTDGTAPNSVPEDPKEPGGTTEEPADPDTLRRWWTEYFEAQRKHKKVHGQAPPAGGTPSWAFPPPPSETESCQKEEISSIVIQAVEDDNQD